MSKLTDEQAVEILESIKETLQTDFDYKNTIRNLREQALLKAISWQQQLADLKNSLLTKEDFHSILSEFPPSIAEDSGQPEWTQGEIDKVWDFITKQSKYICTKDHETKQLVEAKEEIKQQNESLQVMGMMLEGAKKMLADIKKRCGEGEIYNIMANIRISNWDSVEDFNRKIASALSAYILEGKCQINKIKD